MRAYCWSNCNRSSLINKCQNHITSFATMVKTMILTLMDNRAIVECLLEHQLIDPPFSLNIKLDFNLWFFFIIRLVEVQISLYERFVLATICNFSIFQFFEVLQNCFHYFYILIASIFQKITGYWDSKYNV